MKLSEQYDLYYYSSMLGNEEFDPVNSIISDDALIINGNSEWDLYLKYIYTFKNSMHN